MVSSSLNFLMAREQARDRERKAWEARPRVGRRGTPVTRVTLRYSAAADRPRLRELAQLDSGDAPRGRALVAEVDGRLRAALPLGGGEPIADPFHGGFELIELLRLRAHQLAAR